MYSVQTRIYWLDSNNNLEKTSKLETFIGRTKAQVYDYIIYYCGHNGIIDVINIEEGETHDQKT